MDKYTVTATAEFDKRLADIEQDPLGFGPQQTTQYLAEIWLRCDRLEYLPQRFSRETVNGLEYFSFTHKAHKVFYVVDDAEKAVVLITILHGSMKPELHMGGPVPD